LKDPRGRWGVKKKKKLPFPFGEKVQGGQKMPPNKKQLQTTKTKKKSNSVGGCHYTGKRTVHPRGGSKLLSFRKKQN